MILCCKKYINATLDSAARMSLVLGTKLSPHCKWASADFSMEIHLLALGLNMTLNIYFFSLCATTM